MFNSVVVLCASCQLSNIQCLIGSLEGVFNIPTYTHFIFRSFAKYLRIRTPMTMPIFLNSPLKRYFKIYWVNNYYRWYFIGLFYCYFLKADCHNNYHSAFYRSVFEQVVLNLMCLDGSTIIGGTKTEYFTDRPRDKKIQLMGKLDFDIQKLWGDSSYRGFFRIFFLTWVPWPSLL